MNWKRMLAVGAVAAAACTGQQGQPGPQGDRGPEGPPGPGWRAADPHIVSTNTGNIGIGKDAPTAKLDVNGAVNSSSYLIDGAEVVTAHRSGFVTDVARNMSVTVTGGSLGGGGPTNEFATEGVWRTTTFPSSMTVDFGIQQAQVFQVAWESWWRGDDRYIPEYQGPGTYVLEHSQDGATWTQIPSVAPVGGDFFVHPVTLTGATPWFRFLRLTVKAPHVPGNEVHVALFRAFSRTVGDASKIDARRIVSVSGTGPLRLWGQGRPGVVRYGTTGVESGLCTNGNIKFGLSNARVYWEGAAAGCPAGMWVCTRAERGGGPCDTARPDTTCDLFSRSGICEDDPPNGHYGYVADNGYQNGTEGVYVREDGSGGAGGNGNYSMPVWCCSY